MGDCKYLGDNIRKYRKKLGMTQVSLAEALFVSVQCVSSWELNLTKPDIQNLLRLAEVFHTSLDELFQEENEEGYLIGIDGGGTKTEFALFREDGKILHRLILGSSNPNDIGVDACVGILCEGIDALTKNASKILGIFAGIAGCGAGINKGRVHARLSERYSAASVFVESDVVSALALGGFEKNGMALISGTGSVLYARIGEEYRRFGGWGYLFDEAGSAYDFGRGAVQAVLAEKEGRGPATLLSEYLFEQLGGEIWGKLDALYRGGKSYIASLAPAVFRAYRQEDEVAKEIVDKNAKYLASLVRAARKACDCGDKVVVCGGIFEKCGDILLPKIEKEIEGVTFVRATLPQIYGACAECRRRTGLPANAEFENNFTRSYQELQNKEKAL